MATPGSSWRGLRGVARRRTKTAMASAWRPSLASCTRPTAKEEWCPWARSFGAEAPRDGGAASGVDRAVACDDIALHVAEVAEVISP